MEFFEAATTLRAMRRLHPDPIPDEDLWKILDTAIRAPSGGNTQPWNFLVIRDQAAKDKIAAWYLANQEWVQNEIEKVVQLAENAAANLPIPITSFLVISSISCSPGERCHGTISIGMGVRTWSHNSCMSGL